MMPTDNEHSQLNLLLPWYVNGTLDPEERNRVERHLTICLVCKREAQQLQRLQRHIRQAEPPENLSTDVSLSRFWSRVEEPRLSRWQLFIQRLKSWLPKPARLRPALALTLILLVVIPALMSDRLQLSHRNASEAAYRTLTSPSAFTRNDVRLILAARVPRRQLERMLASLPGRIHILEGRPMEHDHSVYIVRVASDKEFDTAVEKLRQLPGAVFAEPVLPRPERMGGRS